VEKGRGGERRDPSSESPGGGEKKRGEKSQRGKGKTAPAIPFLNRRGGEKGPWVSSKKKNRVGRRKGEKRLSLEKGKKGGRERALASEKKKAWRKKKKKSSLSFRLLLFD